MTKVTNDNLSMVVDYDTAGNTTSSTLKGSSGDSRSLVSWTTYYADKNLVMHSHNINNIGTGYSFDSEISKKIGSPTSVVDDLGRTVDYRYNNQNGRNTIAYQPGLISADYFYSNGRLGTISRGGYKEGSTAKNIQNYGFGYDTFGNLTGISLSGNGTTSKTLISYEYKPGNGNLSKSAYGNGATVDYGYDTLDRKTSEKYNDGTEYKYTYTGDGLLHNIKDSSTNQEYVYGYDALGRLINFTEKQSGTVFQYGNHVYDTANRLKKFSYTIPNVTPTGGRKEEYVYSPSNGNLDKMTTAGGDILEYKYTHESQLASRVAKGETVYTLNYGYKTGALPWNTTSLVEWKQYHIGTVLTEFTYEYNAVGNIKQKYNKFDGFYNTYTYDDQNQLETEYISNGAVDYRYTYQYDTYGNMHSKYNGKTKKTDTYTYGNTQWLDLLTAYNGSSITYDAIGNPLTYYNGTKFTWEKGRRLAKAVTTAGTTVKYTYDVDGIRIGKAVTVGTSTTDHKYYIQDGKIVAETWGNNKLEFSYDETGAPFALIYNGTKYYYITNLQGNVVRIMTASGSTVAGYTYDAWGNVISSSGGTIRDINPLRYRGYYYDTETGLYYLNSRYYDPATCRMLNADDPNVLTASMDQPSHDKNLFAYCDNNPVMRKDDGGEFWHIVAGAVVGALVGGIAKAASNVITGNTWNDGLGSAMLEGGASGALASTGVGLVGQIAGGAAISMLSNAAEQVHSNNGFKNFNVGSMLIDGVIGGVGGRLGGAGDGGSYVLKDAAKLLNKNAVNAIKNGVKNGFTSAIKQYGKRAMVKKFYSGLAKNFLPSLRNEFAQNVASRVSHVFIR